MYHPQFVAGIVCEKYTMVATSQRVNCARMWEQTSVGVWNVAMLQLCAGIAGAERQNTCMHKLIHIQTYNKSRPTQEEDSVNVNTYNFYMCITLGSSWPKHHICNMNVQEVHSVPSLKSSFTCCSQKRSQGQWVWGRKKYWISPFFLK